MTRQRKYFKKVVVRNKGLITNDNFTLVSTPYFPKGKGREWRRYMIEVYIDRMKAYPIPFEIRVKDILNSKDNYKLRIDDIEQDLKSLISNPNNLL